MEYTELGATGVDVSVIGLGGGGTSRLGLGAGKSNDDAQRVVETALEEGINLVDTAEAYGTERAIGKAINNWPRDEVVLSTKFSLHDDGELRSPTDLDDSLTESLERLNTEYVDIYHLHGVSPSNYDYVVDELYPQMQKLKEAGSLTFAGITETVSSDPGHDMLTRAVDDDIWDVVMVGFNLLNHSARERVLKPAEKKGIGTIGMVAVRNALSDPAELQNTIRDLIQAGDLDPATVDPENPFAFLTANGGVEDLIDAAYRFARHEPTIDTVLTGTTNPAHLEANVESALKPPLSDEQLAILDDRFGHLDSVLGN